MRAIIVLSTLLAILLSGNDAICDESSSPTQLQWMTALVEGLGWSFGLPEKPEVEDFRRILEGIRQLRIEAEDQKQPTDAVSVKEYRNFGEFSGTGWVSGISTPSTAHLRFILPLSGTYRVTTSLRLPGHQIKIGDTLFRADGGHHFTKVDLGTVELLAGPIEVEIDLPANGSIDFIELSAPPLPSVHPIGEWQPERILSWDDMATTTVRALELEGLLPPTDSEIVLEIEDHAMLQGAQVTDIRHLGAPSGDRWVRATTGEADILVTFSPPEAGVYSLQLRGEGRAPLKFSLNKGQWTEEQFPSYLETLPIGSFYLSAGPNTLDIKTTSRGGVDTLSLHSRRSEGGDYRRLVGLPLDGPPPTTADLDALLSLLAAIGVTR